MSIAVDLPTPSRWNMGGVSVVAAGVVTGAVVAAGGWVYALAGLALALLMRWPVQLALGLFAFLVPFDQVSILGQGTTGTTLNRLAGVVAAIALFASGLVGRRLVLPPRAALWWTIFILWGLLTSFWALDPALAWQRAPTALSFWALYLIATSIQFTETELSSVSVFAVIGGVCAAIITCVGHYQGWGGYHHSGRASLALGSHETDPNFFSASLLLPLSLSIAAIVRSRSLGVRVLGASAALLIAFCILLTMSRGGLIGMALIFFLYLLRSRVNWRVLVAVGCVALACLLLPEQFFSRLHMSDRGAGRMDIWVAGLSALPSYILQGAGWNNFPVAYHAVAGNAPVFHGLARGAHNIFLSAAIEVGAVGFVGMLLAVGSQLKEARDRWLLPYSAAAWGMLAAGMFLDVIWRMSFWTIWMLLAIATRWHRQHPELAS